MSFSVLMVSREEKNHHLFLTTNIMLGSHRKISQIIVYPDCESAIGPAPHDDQNPVPRLLYVVLLKLKALMTKVTKKRSCS